MWKLLAIAAVIVVVSLVVLIRYMRNAPSEEELRFARYLRDKYPDGKE